MQPKWGIQGMAVAPHSLASQSALAVLREGGNSLEAMIAAAATIAVVYPHELDWRRLVLGDSCSWQSHGGH
jgi:gamma-glutamyltranspeptidase/glutathione hydrolase